MYKTPCKECSERVIGCHGNCYKYKEFMIENDKIKHRRHMLADVESYYIDKKLELKRIGKLQNR